MKKQNSTSAFTLIVRIFVSLTIISIFIVPDLTFSQSYRRVSAYTTGPVKSGSDYDNYSAFKFSLTSTEMFSSKECNIIFNVITGSGDLNSFNQVCAFTGYDHEYLEDSKSDVIYGKDVLLTTLTDNLPRLTIVVYYRGEEQTIYLQDVNISFSGSKY